MDKLLLDSMRKVQAGAKRRKTKSLLAAIFERTVSFKDKTNRIEVVSNGAHVWMFSHNGFDWDSFVVHNFTLPLSEAQMDELFEFMQ